MSYLIFCSFEVGGFQYKMAETLNRHGVGTYYISLAQNNGGYNSDEFHYGKRKEGWDLSPLFFKGRGYLNKESNILKDIKERHGVKGCLAVGHRSYLLERAGIKYKYLCYGADLEQSGKISVILNGLPAWKKIVLAPYILLGYTRQQRRSILCASSLLIDFHQFKMCQRLCPEKKFFFLPRLIRTADYPALYKEKIENKNRICREIGARRFFFSPTRHFWAGQNNRLTDYKANDVILYAFARYMKISSDKDSKLILIKRGPDADQTEQLTRKIGINDDVVWIAETRRDNLWPYYQGASLCFGQFGEPILAYTALEPLACATPSISSFAYDSALVPFYATPPPVFNSKDPNEIANFMNDTISNSDKAERLSYNSWLWAKENCSEEKFVESFVKEMDLE